VTQTAKTAEFFYELASSYSYLAATQIAGIEARTGAKIRWRPMLLGGVFQATGNVMPGANPYKLRYLLHDCQRWAKRYGVPFHAPSRFPINTVKALRLCLQAEARGRQPELALSLFRAYWGEDADISDDTTLTGLCEAAGLPGAELLLGCADPAIKAALKEHTDEAVRRGVFGAPAIFIGDELFWGNDRLDFVEEALRG
jgi:2-hydroxychromene-2-carboxylate isomerase